VSTFLESYFAPSELAERVHEEASSSEPLRWNLGDHINHWSPSSLMMLRRCPYQWQQRYIKGRKERPGEAPVVGTAVHNALERNFGQKIESHVDLSTAELLEWYDDVGWPTTLELEQAKAGAEVLWDVTRKDGTPDTDAPRARGRKMVDAYHSGVAPRIQPLTVENEFKTWEFGLAIPVVGRFDLAKQESLVDYKTGKRKYTAPKEDWRIQAAVYAFVEDKPVEFHSISATKNGEVTIVTPLESAEMLVHPTHRQREQMIYSLRAISAEACLYMELFGPEMDWPLHGVHHSWACNYCGFRPTCPAWRDE
jgi:RecB family exonuclease